MYTLGFRRVELVETHKTRIGAFRVGDNLQRSAVWVKWGEVDIAAAADNIQRDDLLSALECIISETRQKGTIFFIGNDNTSSTYRLVDQRDFDNANIT